MPVNLLVNSLQVSEIIFPKLETSIYIHFSQAFQPHLPLLIKKLYYWQNINYSQNVHACFDYCCFHIEKKMSQLVW